MTIHIKRREFLVLSAGTLGGVLIYSLDGVPSLVLAQTHAIHVPLRFFTQEEALAVDALTARIFPKDESGPGAREAGVVIFIDRQLAGPYGRGWHQYLKGPFVDGPPEQGYQKKETPQEIYREGLKPLLGIEKKSEVEQDKAIHAIETTPFFDMLRSHTIEGVFSDPLHGGNKDMIGWQMIGFPGPRMSYAADIDRHYGEQFRPKPVSLREVYRNTYTPLEDEK